MSKEGTTSTLAERLKKAIIDLPKGEPQSVIMEWAPLDSVIAELESSPSMTALATELRSIADTFPDGTIHVVLDGKRFNLNDWLRTKAEQVAALDSSQEASIEALRAPPTFFVRYDEGKGWAVYRKGDRVVIDLLVRGYYPYKKAADKARREEIDALTKKSPEGRDEG